MNKEGDFKRIETGVPGFDKLCDGGFVEDNVMLVLGNAGAGKTTFLLHYLYHGAKSNQPGLYISFEPSVKDLYRAGSRLGMDFEKLENQGKCFFMKLDSSLYAKEIQKRLLALVKKHKIKRVCFDPLNVFALEAGESNLRKQLYELVSAFKELGVSVLIAGEAEENTESSGLAGDVLFSKYLVDGVVELYSSGLGGKGDRAVRISKMRLTNHTRGPVGMKIDSNGMHVLG